ncbi:MAG: hypothetical protein ACRCV0_02300 [Brevinema sp.]
MMKIREVEIKDNSWMQIVINKEDGYVNGRAKDGEDTLLNRRLKSKVSLLADQIGMGLYGFLKSEDIKESIEHIKMLTGDEERYQGESPWSNIKGVYVHPFLALEMVAIKKNEDLQHEEYYEFLKETIFEFLDNSIDLKDKYSFMVDIFDITCSGAMGDCHVNIDIKCPLGTSDIVSSEEFHG